MKNSVEIFVNSHLTTHHPVRNLKSSSAPPVRVLLAYAIRRFFEIPRLPGGRLRIRIGLQSPEENPTESNRIQVNPTISDL